MNKKFIFLLLFILILISHTYAQFYKVYEYKTRAKNETEIAYWTSYVAKSDLTYSFFGKEVERKGLWAHSAEIEYGITDRLTVAIYFDFEDSSVDSLKYIQAKTVFFRYRFAEKGSLFFDPALYVEYNIPKKEYKDYNELEVRLILEKDIGSLSIRLNPIFEKKTSGANQSVEFNYAVGIYCRRCGPVLQPGIEFHGEMGEIGNFIPRKQQRHVIFSTVDSRFGSGFHWHFAAGAGLTEASDKLILKSIFSYKF